MVRVEKFQKVMNVGTSTILFLSLLPPVAFTLVAICSWFQSGIRPKQVITFGKYASFLSLFATLFISFLIMPHGQMESELLGYQQLGFSIRLDALGLTMLSMIAFLALIILKFSTNYLDGDSRQGAFIGRLTATIASVQLFVMSGNMLVLWLAWILTSISLHRLLLFYQNRPGACIAAKKKFILARLADISLFIGGLILYTHFGTGNLEAIFNGVKLEASQGTVSSNLEMAAIFLALAALLKSAQFPTHGWLIEVMETPTPVSALLHAGLLNAGPYLLIRMSHIMDVVSNGPILLMILGGFTALFASVVYLTQTSVKTALGYSSIGHMGFSLMLCGLGAYPAALLHLVGHSFYKAHAFLSSGSLIEVFRGSRLNIRPGIISPFRVVLAALISWLTFVGIAVFWEIDPINNLPVLIIGVVILLGLIRMFSSALAPGNNPAVFMRVLILAVLVCNAFFGLESLSHYVLKGQVPERALPDLNKLLISGGIMAVFTLVVMVQILAPALNLNPLFRSLSVHVRNGFYANALFDRLINALEVNPKQDSADIPHRKMPQYKMPPSHLTEIEVRLESNN